MKKVVLLSALVLLVLAQGAVTAQAPTAYRVIVHPSNPNDALTKADVSGYLLKKKGSWPAPFNGDVAPADLIESPVRAAMSEEIHGRTVASIKTFWQRQIFSGREVPPPELADEAKMVEWVRSKPGAIGYISAGTRADGVKVVTVSN